MKVSANDFDAPEWRVIDKRTGVDVRQVISVDDQTHEIERFEVDENGLVFLRGDELAKVVEHCPRVVLDVGRKRAYIHVDDGGAE